MLLVLGEVLSMRPVDSETGVFDVMIGGLAMDGGLSEEL